LQFILKYCNLLFENLLDNYISETEEN